MTDLQRGIISLIQSSIMEERVAPPAAFSIEDALPVVQQHQIAALAYEGAVRCGIPRDTPAVQSLLCAYCRRAAASEQQLHLMAEIKQAFSENQIDHLLLKGAVLKQLYPKPELRAMSDVDILIRAPQIEQITVLMRDMGFSEGEHSDYEMRWKKDGQLIELHKRLLSASFRSFYEYYGDGWSFARQDTGAQYVLSNEDTFIFLFVHFAKHYYSGGIGCQHMTDLWVYRRSYPAMDEAYIKQELKKLRLEVFYENVVQTLSVWFGNAVDTPVTELITNTVFKSGSYGKKSQHDIYAEMQDAKNGRGVLSKLFHGVFLPREMMQGRYPALQKAPILLPVFYLYRATAGILFKRKTAGNIISRSKKIRAEQIEDYRREMNTVGLCDPDGGI